MSVADDARQAFAEGQAAPLGANNPYDGIRIWGVAWRAGYYSTLRATFPDSPIQEGLLHSDLFGHCEPRGAELPTQPGAGETRRAYDKGLAAEAGDRNPYCGQGLLADAWRDGYTDMMERWIRNSRSARRARLARRRLARLGVRTLKVPHTRRATPRRRDLCGVRPLQPVAYPIIRWQTWFEWERQRYFQHRKW